MQCNLGTICRWLRFYQLVYFCAVQSSDASLFTPYELEKLVQIMQAIGSVRALRDNNMKFRTFICLAMSRGLLCKWLQTLPELRGLCSFPPPSPPAPPSPPTPPFHSPHLLPSSCLLFPHSSPPALPLAPPALPLALPPASPSLPPAIPLALPPASPSLPPAFPLAPPSPHLALLPCYYQRNSRITCRGLLASLSPRYRHTGAVLPAMGIPLPGLGPGDQSEALQQHAARSGADELPAL